MMARGMGVASRKHFMCLSMGQESGEVHRAYIGQCCASPLLLVNNSSFYPHNLTAMLSWQRNPIVNINIVIWTSHPRHRFHDYHYFQRCDLYPFLCFVQFLSFKTQLVFSQMFLFCAGFALIRKKLGDCSFLCPKHSWDKKGLTDIQEAIISTHIAKFGRLQIQHI